MGKRNFRGAARCCTRFLVCEARERDTRKRKMQAIGGRRANFVRGGVVGSVRTSPNQGRVARGGRLSCNAALRASWSKVMISPPALRILSRAFSVTRRAHRVILGTSKILRSLVTVPTQTVSLLALPSFFRFLTRRARDSGGRSH